MISYTRTKLFILGLFLLGSILGVGCSRSLNAPVMPPRGLLFTSITAPLDLNFKSTAKGDKKGGKETMYIKDPYIGTTWGFGNIGIKEAAAEAGINEVDYVDYKYINVFGIYKKIEIIPHGK